MKQSNNKPSTEFEKLGEMVATKRAGLGVRAVAKEIGISPATLSRIERGYTSDIDTFKKVCKWLAVDMGEFLGSGVANKSVVAMPTAAVHFRKNQNVAPATAQALAQLIIVAQKEMASL